MGRAPEPKSKGRSWPARFVVNLLLWLTPVVALWILVTPLYNRFLALSAESLTRAGEFPPVSRLYVAESHTVLVTRSDLSGKDGFIYRFRITDVHFNLLLTAALFLAVPEVARRTRLENLGWALLVSVLFHILVVYFYVKFVYSTQLGAWSNAHYGPLAQNLWGFGKHLLDLPMKLALPFMLWVGFYYRQLRQNLMRS